MISVEVAALQAQPTGSGVGQRAHAVPLDLERPPGVVARRLARPGEHRRHPLGHRLAVGVGRRVHPVDHPVVLRSVAVGAPADRKQPVATGQALAVERDLDLAVLPLVGLVGTRVPDRHRARPVLAPRDLAGELQVAQRVVLGVDGEAVVGRVGWDPVGDRPRRRHPVVLEAQVPMQARGVMLLDDEPCAGGRVAVSPVAVPGRLGGGGEVTLVAVAGELVSGHRRAKVRGRSATAIEGGAAPTPAGCED